MDQEFSAGRMCKIEVVDGKTTIREMANQILDMSRAQGVDVDAPGSLLLIHSTRPDPDSTTTSGAMLSSIPNRLVWADIAACMQSLVHYFVMCADNPIALREIVNALRESFIRWLANSSICAVYEMAMKLSPDEREMFMKAVENLSELLVLPNQAPPSFPASESGADDMDAPIVPDHLPDNFHMEGDEVPPKDCGPENYGPK